MTIRFTLAENQVHEVAPLRLPASPRAIYVRSGSLKVCDSRGWASLGEGDCALFQTAVDIIGPGTAWFFEVTPGEEIAESDLARTILSVPIERDPTAPMLLRGDRVSFPPGAVTPKHGHKGPGIRRLVTGQLVAELGHEVRRIEAGEAWFESGKEPVVGRNLAPSSAFVRVMVLDPSLAGEPTFIPWSAEEAAKPRGTDRHLFFDTIVRPG